jgi:hypothetical protein
MLLENFWNNEIIMIAKCEGMASGFAGEKSRVESGGKEGRWSGAGIAS